MISVSFLILSLVFGPPSAGVDNVSVDGSIDDVVLYRISLLIYFV